MSARFVEVPATEMEAAMLKCGFVEVFPEGCRERTFQLVHIKQPDLAVRVYTTVPRGGTTGRDNGKDAIRVVLVHVQTGKPVWSATRTHRTQGWRERTIERMREAWTAVATVLRCPQCSSPMVLRESKKVPGGGPFWGCVGFPECRGTRPHKG